VDGCGKIVKDASNIHPNPESCHKHLCEVAECSKQRLYPNDGECLYCEAHLNEMDMDYANQHVCNYEGEEGCGNLHLDGSEFCKLHDPETSAAAALSSADERSASPLAQRARARVNSPVRGAARVSLWDEYSALYKIIAGEIRCPICNDTALDGREYGFEAGHVQSFAKSQNNDASNQRPICHKCNGRMGTRHMIDHIFYEALMLVDKLQLQAVDSPEAKEEGIRETERIRGLLDYMRNYMKDSKAKTSRSTSPDEREEE
jgi:hypothetical protein